MVIAASAQDITVKSFRALSMDMTASSLEGKRLDQNGQVTALIKVVTPETGFLFEGGTLGIVDTRQEVGEIWVWVPRASRKITIKHPQLGVLRDYMFPVEIEAERTYEMVLTTDEIEVKINRKVNMQYLAFQITPANAILEVNDKIWEVDAEGGAMDYVNFGTYTYRVQVPNYHTEAGTVTVDNPNETQIVHVTMRPNFGWVEVSGSVDLDGASVYIDNMLIGKAPCKSDAMKSGNHTVRVVKKMYKTHNETVTVSDNEITRLSPKLEPDFAEVTLKVDADAEIWVNDEKKGVRVWSGPLGSGSYKIECRMPSHETSVTVREISADMSGSTITLPPPTPIYGSLQVESTPKFANLFIDGAAYGTTPKSINEILVGQHQIRISKEGYADFSETVTVEKGERRQVTATLSNGREIQFACGVPGATLEIDGQKAGAANGSYMLTYGSHTLRATASGYQDYTSTLNVTESSRSHNIVMQAIRKAPEGAVDGVFSVSSSRKVYFSQGNLQYKASSNTWQFAANQYDYIGDNNSNISQSYSGWIDLFGWGTSGYNGRHPYMTSTTSTDYGGGDADIAGTKYDWGVYNKISNGGNQSGLWRTLTKDEWVYVFNTRSTSSGIRYAKARVNNVNGVVLLPDDWNTGYYSLSSANSADASFSSNTITASQWSALEQHGAVFLPAAGCRDGTSVDDVGSYGDYWSASYYYSDRAYYVWFGGSRLNPQGYFYRDNGQSVRLVRSAQ